MDERTDWDERSRAQRLDERLDGDGGPLRLDGATGTELERRGLPTGLPLWSTHALIEAPEIVREIHAEHAQAGAEILTANTFRTQRRTLDRAGLGPGADRHLTRSAISLARDAALSDTRLCRWVAGSLPPLEDCYAPERVPDAKSLEREHTRQAELIAEAGADLILVETMNSTREAVAACRAAGRTGLPFVVGFVAWAEDALLSGESLSDAARRVHALGARAVGVNCFPPSLLPMHLPVLRDAGVPLLVSPNLGEPNDETGFTRSEDQPPRVFADALDPWLELPMLRIVGGCCGTTPQHVSAIARRIGERATPCEPGDGE